MNATSSSSFGPSTPARSRVKSNGQLDHLEDQLARLETQTRKLHFTQMKD
jgi:hypothetical protein